MLVKDQARQDPFIITACNFLLMPFFTGNLAHNVP